MVVSGDRAEDLAQAVRLETELRRLIRENPSRSFKQLFIARTLRGKPAPYTKSRKDAAKRLAKARTLYEELEIEGSFKFYAEASELAGKALASRLGTRLWLQVEAEYGLRMAENGNSDGEERLRRIFALDNKLEIEAVTPTGELLEKVTEFRHMDPGQGKLNFKSSRPMQISIAGIPSCVSPCSVSDLPLSGAIPWRAEADGLEAQGGLAEAGDTVSVPVEPLPGYEKLLKALAPFQKLFADESDEALEALATEIAPPQLFWAQIRGKRVQLVRVRLRGKRALLARHYLELSGGEDEISKALLRLLETTMSKEATVEPPPKGPSIWARLGIGPKLAKLSSRVAPYKRPALIGLAGLAGTALLVGGVMVLADDDPTRVYDPILGY